MAKYQKLAIAPDGAIVYRSSGRVAKGNLTLKDNRVYKNGRLYGYVGKTTKAEQQRIEKVASSPARKRRAKVEVEAKRILSDGVEIQPFPSVTTNKSVKEWLSKTSITADAVKLIRTKYNDRGSVEISKVTQSQLNYAKVISKAVNAGKIKPADADKMLKAMYNAKDHMERLELWKETADLFEKMGYKYTIHSRVKDAEE